MHADREARAFYTFAAKLELIVAAKLELIVLWCRFHFLVRTDRARISMKSGKAFTWLVTCLLVLYPLAGAFPSSVSLACSGPVPCNVEFAKRVCTAAGGPGRPHL